MIKKEKRWVNITYCDECGEDLTAINGYISIIKGSKKLDFCPTSGLGDGKDCLEKYREKENK